MRKRSWLVAMAGMPLLLSGLLPAPAASAASPVSVVLDGKLLALDPAPTIVDDRTLVPMRGLLEAMGATITWDGENRVVTATRNGRYVRLKIDRRLACLNETCTEAATLDVPARIIGDRTFVPARFVSQAMGARVSWDNEQRAVVVETSKAPDYAFTSLTIPTLTVGQVIEGPVQLQAQGAEGSHVQFYLIDPATGTGPLIAAGSDVKAAYTYTPDPTVKGARLVVAEVKDAGGVLRYSDPVRVTLAPKPVVRVTGIERNGTITGPITLNSSANFVSTQTTLQVLDANGTVQDLGSVGAIGNGLTWYPQVGHNGDRWLKAVASDRYGNKYESEAVPVKVASGYRQVIPGIEDGKTLTGPVTLKPSYNYPVEAVKYVIDGQVAGWGWEYKWNITEALNGPHTLKVELLAKDGSLREIGPFNLTVNVVPSVSVSGVGPGEVVTGAITLTASSNMDLVGADWFLTKADGTQTLLGRGAAFKWTPTAAQAGNQTIHVVAKDSKGRFLSSEKVKFRVFLGTVFGPKAIATRDEFRAMASGLAVSSYRESGMAASLQVAQSLLETGHGQSVPVDKYTGQLSYNLFGIKGTGPAGSITSNTWEVYNGRSFRVDANFRAYHSVEEAWRDHKSFLLERPWYAPFRAVITDPVLGAYALKFSGYATDPAYPTKLIEIMDRYDLYKLNILEL